MTDDRVTGARVRVVTVQMNEMAKSTGSGTWMLRRVSRAEASLGRVGDYNISALSLNKQSQVLYHSTNTPSL